MTQGNHLSSKALHMILLFGQCLLGNEEGETSIFNPNLFYLSIKPGCDLFPDGKGPRPQNVAAWTQQRVTLPKFEIVADKSGGEEAYCMLQ